MTSEIVGREEELASLGSFLDREPGGGPAALVLEGEAGIGKSTLWLAGITLARERGIRVLSARPAEAEQGLAFAGLGDLFEDALDEVLPSLPPPRRLALEVALLIDESDDAVDPRALGVAVRNGLETLARKEPLLVAVDDVQWLDRSSLSALAFAVRRTDAPASFLLARRLAAGIEPSELEGAFAAGVERLPVGPLSVGAIQALVRERLNRSFTRPTILRIHETAGANPFYALELARVFGGDVDPTQPLPVPETLEELVSARLAGLPEATREALAVVAALGVASAAFVPAAGFADDVLEPALVTRVVEREDGKVRFTHPLLASVLYQGLSGDGRRRTHRLAAGVVDDPIARARQLALASDGPDEQIAASLEEAAGIASLRGVPTVAVELGELAHRLTPRDDDEGRHRRATLAAVGHLRAGDVQRARLLADELLTRAPRGRARAEVLVLLSGVESREGHLQRAVDLRRKALREADTNLALQAAIHQWLGANAPYDEGFRAREQHARASLALAEQLGDGALRAGALAVLSHHLFETGEPEALSLAEEAYALATELARQGRTRSNADLAHLLAWLYDRLDQLAAFTLADILATLRRFDRAREVLDDIRRDVAERDELMDGKALWVLSLLELDAGRWPLAADYITREREIWQQYGLQDKDGVFLVRAQLALHTGELELARELAWRGRELAEGFSEMHVSLEAVLGITDHLSGDLDGAIACFVVAERLARGYGWGEPSMYWWRGDYAEALIEAGRVDDAVGLLDEWEETARRLGRDWVIAHVTRCRGLAAAARGEVDEALVALERAVYQIEGVEDPFGGGRALLALGVTRRRARRKRAARDAIERALAIFDELGEANWTARARAELGRIGGRRREEGLTAAEKRVAALVAEGRTNREVAAALVLGERTVETHLTHVYAKLGVRSRTELARAFTAE